MRRLDMAVAFVQEFEIAGGDRSTANYDAVAARLGDEVPSGLIVHTAGFDEERGVFRILDVWESEQDARRFIDERLMPIVEELLANRTDAPPPNREYYYELHHVVKG
jgi:hypothetical protein